MKRTRSRCVLAVMVLSLLFSSVGFAFADSNVPTPRDNRHYMVYHDKSMYKTASYSLSQNQIRTLMRGGAAAVGIISLATGGAIIGGVGILLGYISEMGPISDLRVDNVFTTERKYYSKDRLTGRESYLRTEWIGTTTWKYRQDNGRWKVMFIDKASLSLK